MEHSNDPIKPWVKIILISVFMGIALLISYATGTDTTGTFLSMPIDKITVSELLLVIFIGAGFSNWVWH